jgi:hypothetical protein
MVDRSAFHTLVSLCAMLFVIVLLQPASADTHDQIVKKCRQLMRPQIVACAQAKGLMGNHDAVREQCGMALIHPCVMRESGGRGR